MPSLVLMVVKVCRGAVFFGGEAVVVLMPLLPLGLHPPLVEASPAPPLHSLHQHRTQCSPLHCTSILHCTAPLHCFVFLKFHCTQLWLAQTNTAACTNIALNALFWSTSMASNCTAHLYYIILQPEKHRTQSSALYLQVALHTVTQVWPALALPAMGTNCIAAEWHRIQSFALLPQVAHCPQLRPAPTSVLWQTTAVQLGAESHSIFCITFQHCIGFHWSCAAVNWPKLHFPQKHCSATHIAAVNGPTLKAPYSCTVKSVLQCNAFLISLLCTSLEAVEDVEFSECRSLATKPQF